MRIPGVLGEPGLPEPEAGVQLCHHLQKLCNALSVTSQAGKWLLSSVCVPVFEYGLEDGNESALDEIDALLEKSA